MMGEATTDVEPHAGLEPSRPRTVEQVTPNIKQERPSFSVLHHHYPLIYAHTHKRMKSLFCAELQSAEPHNQCVRSSVFMWERGREEERQRGRRQSVVGLTASYPAMYNRWKSDM